MNRGIERAGTRVALWSTILSVSLIGNALLGYLFFRRHLAPPATSQHARITSHTTQREQRNEARAGDGSGTKQHHVGDINGIVAEWRAAGVEPRIVRSLAIALVQDKYAEPLAELAFPEGKPFWQMGSFTRAQSAEIERERSALLAEIVGEPVDLRTQQQKSIEQQLYGDLPAEKITQITQISSEYREVRGKVEVGDPDRAAKLAKIDEEMHRDIATILTPAELVEFDRKQSKLGKRRKGP